MNVFPLLCSLSSLAALLGWAAILLLPGTPWELRPRDDEDADENDDEDEDDEKAGESWPEVIALVPARNEADVLSETLPALLKQEYPGKFRVFLTDDRSDDGTGELARKLAAECEAETPLTVVEGRELPAGEEWVGKMWALEQAARAARLSPENPPTAGEETVAAATNDGDGNRRFILLTDADIRHAPDSLRRLVVESVRGGLGLNSRMARLRCKSPAEKLLMPAFLFFFNLLYPMRRVNSPRDKCAAAAGGCLLLSEEAWRAAGGFRALRNELIDDVATARRVKAAGFPLRLALSDRRVVSLRAYEKFGAIRAMVRRTAFTELKGSWPRLLGATAALLLLFAVPPLACAAGAWAARVTASTISAANADGGGITEILAAAPAGGLFLWAGLKGAAALALMFFVYRPATRWFHLSPPWTATLPAAGVLYLAMTLESAFLSLFGIRSAWRGRVYRRAQTEDTSPRTP